ncbi:MAG TPA: response regulator transcription factor [Solirubrobacteraceae bacterium]|jgi:DNA-binding NarL/FixJ family response regulator|nr:response regulator transcription factor [Solirubrobacteraceae bacterium]
MSTGNRTRVLIADDHPLILAGIRRALDRSDGVEVVGEASSGPQVVAMVERRRPEVVLLDLYMPGVKGAELIAKIRDQWPEVKTVVLSANEDRASIDSALNAGASAYIVKSVNPSDLSSVIRQVAGGAIFHAPSRPTSGSPEAEEPAGPDLTERERTILAAIASGQTTAAISRELWVSEHTIKFHLTNIYRKLGVSNRAGAVRFAIEHGLAA